MTQLRLLLPRTDHAPPDEETGVRIAWAIDGGRPVHIARYSHLRDGGARPELSCLGCSVPVVPVLPPRGRGRPHRQDFFRHKRRSPDCWAHHGLGAQLWNATLHVHQALDDLHPLARSRLFVRAFCDASQSPWASTLPLFSAGCGASANLPVPAFDRVGLSPTRPGQPKVPDVRLFNGPREVLRIRIEPSSPLGDLPPLAPAEVPVVEVCLDEAIYQALLAWRPTRDQRGLPCTRATPDLSYRCPAHPRPQNMA